MKGEGREYEEGDKEREETMRKEITREGRRKRKKTKATEGRS